MVNMSSIMVAVVFMLTLNISMANEWILQWWIVKEKNRDLKMRVLKKLEFWKGRPRSKVKHFTKSFIYRNIKTDMHDHMLKNVHYLIWPKSRFLSAF